MGINYGQNLRNKPMKKLLKKSKKLDKSLKKNSEIKNELFTL
jgi:hypothetical protein